MFKILSLVAAVSTVVTAGTLYLPAYPASVLVFDESKAEVVGKIPLETGTPMSIRLSPDKRLIYVTTIDHNGIEVIDVATRKVINHFVLNTPTKQFRFWGGAPDPQGKFFYTITKEIDQKISQYEVNKPMYTVIDLEQQKIVKTVEVPKEVAETRDFDYSGSAFQLSPDGKYLYKFGESITVLQASDFKEMTKLTWRNLSFLACRMFALEVDLDLTSIWRTSRVSTWRFSTPKILSFITKSSVWRASI